MTLDLDALEALEKKAEASGPWMDSYDRNIFNGAVRSYWPELIRLARIGQRVERDASPGPLQECVSVPVVPTRAMEDAACAAGDNGNLSGQYLRNIWKAMLTAAQEEHDAHR